MVAMTPDNLPSNRRRWDTDECGFGHRRRFFFEAKDA
jgi:hypothetical protein